MLLTSTALLIGVAIGIGLERWRAHKHASARARDPRHEYMSQQGTRLLLAQHWARGSMLSAEWEPWRPALTGLSFAALAVRDLEEVEQLLRATMESVTEFGHAGDGSPAGELHNLWGQAMGELLGAKKRAARKLGSLTEVERESEIRTMTGIRSDGSPDWNHAAIWDKAAQMLVGAQKSAANLLAKRAVRSEPPEAPTARKN
jgi:hypothetical protein